MKTQLIEISTNIFFTSTCIKPANEIEDQESTKLAVLAIGLDIERVETSTFVGTAGCETKLTVGATSRRDWYCSYVASNARTFGRVQSNESALEEVELPNRSFSTKC